MSALHELDMFKSSHGSFAKTHARTTARWLSAAAQRVVPVIVDAALPAASVPPREPPVKQGQLLRMAEDERGKAEARHLKLRAKYRVDKLAVVVTLLWKYPCNELLLCVQFKYEDLQRCLQRLGKRLGQPNATFLPDPYGLPCPP